jgi:hypothetical protein
MVEGSRRRCVLPISQDEAAFPHLHIVSWPQACFRDALAVNERPVGRSQVTNNQVAVEPVNLTVAPAYLEVMKRDVGIGASAYG